MNARCLHCRNKIGDKFIYTKFCGKHQNLIKSGFEIPHSEILRDKKLNKTVTESFILSDYSDEHVEYVRGLSDLNELIISWDDRFNDSHIEYMSEILSQLDPSMFISEGTQRIVIDTGRDSVYKFAKSYDGLVANYRELRDASKIHDLTHDCMKVQNAQTWSSSEGICLIEMIKISQAIEFYQLTNRVDDEILSQSGFYTGKSDEFYENLNKVICFDFGGFAGPDSEVDPVVDEWLDSLI